MFLKFAIIEVTLSKSSFRTIDNDTFFNNFFIKLSLSFSWPLELLYVQLYNGFEHCGLALPHRPHQGSQGAQLVVFQQDVQGDL